MRRVMVSTFLTCLLPAVAVAQGTIGIPDAGSYGPNSAAGVPAGAPASPVPWFGQPGPYSTPGPAAGYAQAGYAQAGHSPGGYAPAGHSGPGHVVHGPAVWTAATPTPNSGYPVYQHNGPMSTGFVPLPSPGRGPSVPSAASSTDDRRFEGYATTRAGNRQASWQATPGTGHTPPIRQVKLTPDIDATRIPSPTPTEADPRQLTPINRPEYGYQPVLPELTPPDSTFREPNPWTDWMYSYDFLARPLFARLHKVRATGTWLPGGTHDLSMIDVDLRGTIGFDWNREITVSPGIGVHLVGEPEGTDLPGLLYDAYAEFRWMRQVTPQFGWELAATPAFYTDGDNTGSDAIRVLARALGFYAVSERTQFVFGAVYLDRENLTALPALGVIHSVIEDIRFELVFPRPKMAIRFNRTDRAERWMYLAGEFGGGTWAIERAGGADDTVTMSDYRVIFGVESKTYNGPTWLLEAGYVFNREVEYESGIGDFNPDETMIMRFGYTY